MVGGKNVIVSFLMQDPSLSSDRNKGERPYQKRDCHKCLRVLLFLRLLPSIAKLSLVMQQACMSSSSRDVLSSKETAKRGNALAVLFLPRYI